MDDLWPWLPDGSALRSVAAWQEHPDGSLELVRGAAALGDLDPRRRAAREGNRHDERGMVVSDPYAARFIDLVDRVSGFGKSLELLAKLLEEDRDQTRRTSDQLIVLSGKMDRSMERFEADARSIGQIQTDIQQRVTKIAERVDVIERDFIRKGEIVHYTQTVNTIEVLTRSIKELLPWFFASVMAFFAAHTAGVRLW